MPELRKDYVTDTWVVFSASRAQRPGAFRGGTSTTDPLKCPFCYGHEHMTPPEVLAYRKDGVPNGPGWWIRCVPNKYPALQVEGEVQRRVSQLFHSVNGVGAHEVIVETPEHEHHLSMQSEFQVQLITTPIVPRWIMEEVNSLNRFYESTGGSCLYCEIVETELEEEKRIVSENESFVCLSPYAARFPFEAWILPKAHEMAFEDIADDERTPFARILKDILGRMPGILDDPPFNYYIHTAPCDRKETKYHWHLEITPRLTETAGFERGTGFYINPVMPEDAAAILRERVKLSDKPH